MTASTKSSFYDTIALYDSLDLKYSAQYGDFCAQVLISYERGRFWTWGEVQGFTENGTVKRNISDEDINVNQEQMLQIRGALQEAIVYAMASATPEAVILPANHFLVMEKLYDSLRCTNDVLQNLLLDDRRSSMETLWPRRNIVENISALYSTFSTVHQTVESLPLRARTKLRPTAAAKYMGQLRKQRKIGKSKDLFVENMVDIELDFGDHSIGRLKAGDGNDSLVLVEWKCYDHKWTSDEGKELYIRIGELAELLHHPGKHGLEFLRVLDCLGWFHDAQECRFGFVFSIIEKPVSLFTLIPQTPLKGVLPPPLGVKFQLATMMAKCIHDVHAIGWLHKNISAHNIIFFASLGDMSSKVAPYLTGFNHSRTDEEKAFTEGPSISNRHVEYQHPDYRASGKRGLNRFKRIHDYYSFGLILLEIALWTPFSRIASKKSTLTAIELRQFIIVNYIPMLGGLVGVCCRDAVMTCLRGDFGDRSGEESDDARKETLAIFYSNVVEPLSKCFA